MDQSSASESLKQWPERCVCKETHPTIYRNGEMRAGPSRAWLGDLGEVTGNRRHHQMHPHARMEVAECEENPQRRIVHVSAWQLHLRCVLQGWTNMRVANMMGWFLLETIPPATNGGADRTGQTGFSEVINKITLITVGCRPRVCPNQGV